MNITKLREVLDSNLEVNERGTVLALALGIYHAVNSANSTLSLTTNHGYTEYLESVSTKLSEVNEVLLFNLPYSLEVFKNVYEGIVRAKFTPIDLSLYGLGNDGKHLANGLFIAMPTEYDSILENHSTVVKTLLTILDSEE